MSSYTLWSGCHGSTADSAQKRPERSWTATRTIEVLRRCPLAIAQRLVHCTVAVSTSVLGRVTSTAVEEQLEVKEVKISRPSSTSLLMVSSGLEYNYRLCEKTLSKRRGGRRRLLHPVKAGQLRGWVQEAACRREVNNHTAAQSRQGAAQSGQGAAQSRQGAAQSRHKAGKGQHKAGTKQARGSTKQARGSTKRARGSTKRARGRLCVCADSTLQSPPPTPGAAKTGRTTESFLMNHSPNASTLSLLGVGEESEGGREGRVGWGGGGGGGEYSELQQGGDGTGARH